MCQIFSLPNVIVCVYGCGGCSCSWSGRCRCRCSSCHRRIPDAACQAANAACRALKAPLEASLNAARDTLNTLSRSLDTARDALHAAERGVNAARQALTEATNSLNAVQNTFQQGLQLLDHINNLGGLQNILAIQEISIEAPLNQAALGRYSATIRARILGQQQNVNVQADLNDITGTMLRPLADRLGIGNLL